MRIISGKFGGQRLIIPRNLPIRPTTDIAKEGLFNILNNSIDFETVRVADFFAGSGSIGFEFISRGNKDLTFIENNYKCIKHLSNTAKKFCVQVKIIPKDVFKEIKNLKKNYDIVFADPPYKLEDDKYFYLIKFIQQNILKNDESILIIEHYKKRCFKNIKGYISSRSYGDCTFTFFKQKSG